MKNKMRKYIIEKLRVGVNAISGWAKRILRAIKMRKKRKPRIVIWFHSGENRSNEALKEALSSGLITHVIVYYRSRVDGAWNSKPWIVEAINIVKASDAKLIWSRGLWAWYAVEDAKFEDLLNPEYYKRELKNVRAEAKEMKADFCAIDTEPYANSPMKKYMLGKERIRLSDEQYQQLQIAVKQALHPVRKVDFIYPSGSWIYKWDTHPWNILVGLGNIRICENTYYDNANSIAAVPYPYDIFGAFVNIIKENANNPIDPYFLVHEIFDREEELWSHKKGLFIYTSNSTSLAVAKKMVEYSKNKI